MYAPANTLKIDKVVNDAISDNTILIREKKLTVNLDNAYDLTIKNGSKVKYSKELLYLLFSNLINNSAKYSPESTNIDIVFTKDEKYINVTITNCGTLEDELALNFFSKYSKGGDKSNGMGFGTYCCKLITDLFRGKIRMDQDGEVISISVKLPY